METIDLAALGTLSSSTKAVLNKDQKITQLIGQDHAFIDLSKAIEGKANFENSKRLDLVKALKTDYANFGIDQHPLVNANIEALLHADTYTVTTGQQLHLFLGPAFMVYKLISTIKAAEHYSKLYPNKKFVPVFWLASEDHDFEEIKNTPLFGQNFQWETSQTGACGRYHLKDIESVFEPLKVKLNQDPKAMALIASFESIYKNSANLSEATIKLTHQLFADYGLVCLDADNALLKAHFKTILKAELSENKSEQSFNHFSQLLNDSQLSLQLKSRPINLFYLKDNVRARIEKEGPIYKVHDTPYTFTEAEIIAEVEQHPEHFSPNAVLRPLYQECILPNVAYIGGNAEINYWLQLAEVFKLYQTEAPYLVLRQSVWYIKQKQKDWLDSQHLSFEQLFQLKTEKEKLAFFNTNETGANLEQLVNAFSDLKTQIQVYANDQKLPNIKVLIEGGKAYERVLKDLIKSDVQAKLEKNEKTLKKLEQIHNEGFSIINIQERNTYALTFFINFPDFVNNCFSSVYYQPGTGFFLNN